MLAVARARTMAFFRSGTISYVRAPSLAKPSFDGGDDLQRVFVPGIVRGQDGPVGQPGGDPAHALPLVLVAVAAGAEDEDDPTRLELPGRHQEVLEGVVRVGVIDDDVEAAAVLDASRSGPARP